MTEFNFEMVFQWIRRAVRRNTRPIPLADADRWKKRLSLAYGFLAWNALAFVGLAMYNGRRDWAEYHGLEMQKGSPCKLHVFEAFAIS